MTKYSVVYADPAWTYSNNTKSENHFVCETTKEMAKLDVLSVCERDVILFMWTTGPKMDEAIDLLRAWGFKYRSMGFVWKKPQHTCGSYTLAYTEFCLIAIPKRSRIPKPRGTRNERQLIESPRGRFAAKPAEARLRIERMFPTQKKLEMFAREKHPGWDVWGNEVGSDVHIPWRGRDV